MFLPEYLGQLAARYERRIVLSMGGVGDRGRARLVGALRGLHAVAGMRDAGEIVGLRWTLLFVREQCRRALVHTEPGTPDRHAALVQFDSADGCYRAFDWLAQCVGAAMELRGRSAEVLLPVSADARREARTVLGADVEARA